MSWFAVRKESWSERLATWFRCGRSPKAPGTVGTLGAIPLVLLFSFTGQWGYLALTVIFCFVAIEVSDAFEKQHNCHDAKEIVIDEVAGFLVAMAWLPMTWQSFAAGFTLFRVLDALKPWPISWVDRNGRGGMGVVADDLLAGIITNIVLQIVFVQTEWLGLQWHPNF